MNINPKIRKWYKIPVNGINKFRFHCILLLIILLIFLTFKLQQGYAQTKMALKNDHIEVFIEIEGQNIQSAKDKENPIEIQPSGDIFGKLVCKIIGNETIHINYVKIGFIIFDREVFSKEMELNVSLS